MADRQCVRVAYGRSTSRTSMKRENTSRWLASVSIGPGAVRSQVAMEEQDLSLRTRFRQVGQHVCHRRNADSGAGEHHGTVGVLHDHVAKRCGESHLVSDVHGVVEEVGHLSVGPGVRTRLRANCRWRPSRLW